MNRYGTKIASVEQDVAEITNMELIGVEWDGRNSLAWIWWWATSSSSPSAAHPTAARGSPTPCRRCSLLHRRCLSYPLSPQQMATAGGRTSSALDGGRRRRAAAQNKSRRLALAPPDGTAGARTQHGCGFFGELSPSPSLFGFLAMDLDAAIPFSDKKSFFSDGLSEPKKYARTGEVTGPTPVSPPRMYFSNVDKDYHTSPHRIVNGHRDNCSYRWTAYPSARFLFSVV